MNKSSHKVLVVICFAAAVALGSWQGVRVRHLREAESFYRWILAQSTQVRLFAGEDDLSDQNKNDIALYNEIVKTAEPVLPDIKPGDDDYAADGKPMDKMTIAARDEQYSGLVFDLARGNVLAKQREEFLNYTRNRKISSVGSEFDIRENYGEGLNVSLANIFFGFRKVAANFLWLQVDKYWHQGMEQRMIPSMKMCVWLDPTFVDAFLLGAWHLSYNMTAKMPDTPEPLKKWNDKYKAYIGEKELYYHIAIDFLKDGIRKNPRNYKLYFDLGYGIYNLKMKDYDNAVKYLTEAVRYPHEVWVPRMLNISLEEAGHYEQALAGWEAFLKRNPGHLTALSFITRNQARIQEQKGYEAAQRAIALAQTDPAGAAAAKEEAEKYRNAAIGIYNKMNEGGEDPFAVGRIMKIKADRFMEQGLYMEAAALLQNARWKCTQSWDEFTDLMIEAKTKANMPLELSEKKYVLRKKEAEEAKLRAQAKEQEAAGTVQ